MLSSVIFRLLLPMCFAEGGRDNHWKDQRGVSVNLRIKFDSQPLQQINANAVKKRAHLDRFRTCADLAP
jgi:hypothetical protein